MKTICTLAAIGLSFAGSMTSVVAQGYYGGRGEEYEGRRGYGYEDRGYRDDRDDRGYRDDREDRGRRYGFDEREYLRCNPDVLRAVRSGQMESGAAHYRVYGRREHRRLSC